MPALRLDHFTSPGLAAWLAAAERSAVIWPVGSVEPHGPHLPLGTDLILSTRNAGHAAVALREVGVAAAVAPPLPYGVTEFARDFPGAISVGVDTVVALLVEGAAGMLRAGFDHVCLVNHHLEPGQLAALARAVATVAAAHGAHAISAPQVVSRRWGGRLGAEFRSGACHAGQYEGSLVLAAQPHLVDLDAAAALPEVPVSLSAAIAAGATSFMEAGATAAYTGRPAAATAAEGDTLYTVLTEMVVTEVLEHLERRPG